MLCCNGKGKAVHPYQADPRLQPISVTMLRGYVDIVGLRRKSLWGEGCISQVEKRLLVCCVCDIE